VKSSGQQVAAVIGLDTYRWLKDWADAEHRSQASVIRQVLEERREQQEAA
jgi:hypothetical protein